MTNVSELPSDLPAPVDDGACDHLPGLAMPALRLASTAGRLVDLAALSAPRTVIYCYPKTGRPGQPLPDGWDMIPGARGCTPQTCASARRRPSTSARWSSGCTCRSRC